MKIKYTLLLCLLSQIAFSADEMLQITTESDAIAFEAILKNQESKNKTRTIKLQEIRNFITFLTTQKGITFDSLLSRLPDATRNHYTPHMLESFMQKGPFDVIQDYLIRYYVSENPSLVDPSSGTKTTLSHTQAQLLEGKFLDNASSITIQEARRLLRYIINSNLETPQSLLLKISKGKKIDYTPEDLENFLKGGFTFNILKYLKDYYANNGSSIVATQQNTEEQTPPKKESWFSQLLSLCDFSTKKSSDKYQHNDGESINDEKESLIKKTQ